MRPLGLLVIWKVNDTEPKWEIMKHGLFGYYQNGVDYLNEYARAKGWTEDKPLSGIGVAYKTGQYKIELNLVQPTGLDLSKETYLHDEKEEAKQTEEHPAS